MRRIYESNALHRDDEESHAPREHGRDAEPQAMRSVPSGTLSRLLVPHWLRYRAIGVDVEIPVATVDRGERVPFRVTLRNALPFPVTVPVTSPVPWHWSVDGHSQASTVDGPPEGRRGFHFDRGERKTFSKRWSGSFKIGAHEWQLAEAGEHVVSVELAVPDAESKGLTAEATVRVVDS